MFQLWTNICVGHIFRLIQTVLPYRNLIKKKDYRILFHVNFKLVCSTIKDKWMCENHRFKCKSNLDNLALFKGKFLFSSVRIGWHDCRFIREEGNEDSDLIFSRWSGLCNTKEYTHIYMQQHIGGWSGHHAYFTFLGRWWWILLQCYNKNILF